eukprot:6206994-Pleurochrysis_carterae.AAC.3
MNVKGRGERRKSGKIGPKERNRGRKEELGGEGVNASGQRRSTGTGGAQPVLATPLSRSDGCAAKTAFHRGLARARLASVTAALLDVDGGSDGPCAAQKPALALADNATLQTEAGSRAAVPLAAKTCTAAAPVVAMLTSPLCLI